MKIFLCRSVLWAFFVVAATFSPAFADTAETSYEHDFRSAEWGMSPEEVRRSEPGLTRVQPGTLAATDTVAGFPVRVYFEFVDDKLVKGYHYVLLSHPGWNPYVDDFERLKSYLADQYGKPDSDLVLWEEGALRSDRSGWGRAVAVGDLQLRAFWTLPETEITLLLTGEDYQIGLGTVYESRRH
jgi:hypothetical protein